MKKNRTRSELRKTRFLVTATHPELQEISDAAMREGVDRSTFARLASLERARTPRGQS